MNLKTFSLFFLACFVLILCLSSTTSGTLQGYRGSGYKTPEGLRPERRIQAEKSTSPPGGAASNKMGMTPHRSTTAPSATNNYRLQDV
ncbi:hypothetical protein K7X08_021336 [Anisodus acutangulus]|uniref:Uncharacterized protein n=1 Tax=Anisodus acutangulus TaxID=402998 RepID=A0A9Q1M106_9SOLA|nr:hypothetical protein K7X08_021336 [Anisodus acutangulus]